MTLGERLSLIVQEAGITQNAFSQSLGKTPNHMNQVINGKKPAISLTLALLIQELYGYSAHWIMTGEGDKKAYPTLDHMKMVITKRIAQMPEDEVTAVLAFANSLESVKAALKLKSE